MYNKTLYFFNLHLEFDSSFYMFMYLIIYCFIYLCIYLFIYLFVNLFCFNYLLSVAYINHLKLENM